MLIESFSYGTAFTVGLLGSIHCIGMCGGIVGLFTLHSQACGKDAALWPRLLIFNIGRVTSYTVAGLLAGMLGQTTFSVFSSEIAAHLAALLSVLFMLALGLYLGGWASPFMFIEKLGARLIWAPLQPIIKPLLPVTNLRNALIVGLFWGWLPCGMVYALLVGAVASANILSGAMLMAVFGIGTIPGMMIMGAGTINLNNRLKNPIMRKIVGVVVCVLAGVAAFLYFVRA